MPKLLLLEDEENLAFALGFNLEQEGHAVTHAATLAECRQQLSQNFDLMIFDVMLPDGSGFDMCREVRSRGIKTPILFLTAKGTPDDVVAGLESGGDDYLTKPFALKELIARVSAILRRQAWDRDAPETASEGLVRMGIADIDFRRHKLFSHGQGHDLTALEVKLIRYFMDRGNQIVSREDLLTGVWEVSPQTNTRSVDNFLVRIRRLIEADPAKPRHLLTVRGIGYRYAPQGE